MDKYTKHPYLLGEEQNAIEGRKDIHENHSILSPDKERGEGHYKYNPNGVTTPVFGSGDKSSWLEMGKVDKMTKGKFKELTKTESHPKGINFDHFTNALLDDYRTSHGQESFYDTDEQKDHETLRSHPLYQNTENFIHHSDNHPADLSLRNYGIWKHPVTGKEHPVITDYGYSTQISKLYSRARQERFQREKFGVFDI